VDSFPRLGVYSFKNRNITHTKYMNDFRTIYVHTPLHLRKYTIYAACKLRRVNREESCILGTFTRNRYARSFSLCQSNSGDNYSAVNGKTVAKIDRIYIFRDAAFERFLNLRNCHLFLKT